MTLLLWVLLGLLYLELPAIRFGDGKMIGFFAFRNGEAMLISAKFEFIRKFIHEAITAQALFVLSLR